MSDAVNKAGDAGRNVDKDLGFCAMGTVSRSHLILRSL